MYKHTNDLKHAIHDLDRVTCIDPNRIANALAVLEDVCLRHNVCDQCPLNMGEDRCLLDNFGQNVCGSEVEEKIKQLSEQT